LLPGQRDLLGFCPQAGRALLLRHWPDYRRSIERIEPGLAPRQLWLGHQAVLAAACERGGDTIWALLMDGLGAPRLELLALDPNGRVRRRRRLDGWEPEPGTSMQFDPTSGQLLLSLRRLAGDRGTASTGNDTSAEAQPVLIDSGSLQLRPLAKKIRQAVWLPPG
jgi:hypothetical protein